MNKTKFSIVLKNGKEYIVYIPLEDNTNINEVIKEKIFTNYNRENAVNMNTFDLVPTLERIYSEFNSVVINMNDISAIEYLGGV